MKVYMDNREPENVIKMARKHFDEVEVRQLPSSDLMYGDVGIERKTVTDFVASVQDGRVFKQASTMKLNFNKSFIIIIGDHSSLRFTRYHFGIDNYLGAIASLAADEGVPCLTVKNSTQFFKLSKKLLLKGNRESKPHIEWKKPISHDPIVSMIGCVPGIGAKKAQAVVDYWKPEVISDLACLSLEQICEVDGIGPKQGERIKNIIS